ncbi:MAG TPA: aspartyl/asparaginyl beta-hydroxylase domain-containing protein [Bacteroidia bacterium]|nr:aspartyl/asparaginyl beta-hydroxylase domain-containing protein [Bacteroidia bacterium]
MNLSLKHKTPKLTFYYLKKDITINADETFYDSSQFKWAQTIEANWKLIYEEITTHLQKHEKEFGAYFDDGLVNQKDKWKSFGFYFWGLRLPDKECEHFAKTINLLKKIPDVVSASVSIMEPYSEIKPHFGDTDAIYRCHLPLIVPGILPEIGFQVGYEKYSWKEGKLLIFNDAAYHKGWNNTDKRRLILIFDVIKPVLKSKKRWICSQALANIIIQKMFAKIPFTKKLPLFSIKTLHTIISTYKWIYFSFRKNTFI